MSANPIYASTAVSLAELGRDPGAVIEEAGDSAVAILSHNKATAYLVPADIFEALIDKLEDLELAAIARQRRGGKAVQISLDDL